MSLNSTNFQQTYYPVYPARRQPTAGRSAQFILPEDLQSGQPAQAPKKKGSLMKKILLGAAAIGVGGFLFAKVRPDIFNKGVDLVAPFIPAKVKDGTNNAINYVSAHGGPLLTSAGEKAKTLLNQSVELAKPHLETVKAWFPKAAA